MPSKKSKSRSAQSRCRRDLILLVCVLFVGIFFWLDRSYIAKTWQQRPEASERSAISDFERYHDKTFTVVNVVDGDTIDIDAPDGSYQTTRIRFWGVDTPETKNPRTGTMYFGPEAAEFTKKLALGKKIIIYLDENNNTRGKYGRLLAYIQLEDRNFLNEVLLKEGFAYADLRFRHSFYNRYKQLEAAARGQKKGLWLNVTRRQLPLWLQKEKPSLLRKN
ncbi:MAG: thermonuclease family protein [Sedimentisphaerales bacterium]|nr:thermonuclease family protein [Sedimentisphaerales bacterium]